MPNNTPSNLHRLHPREAVLNIVQAKAHAMLVGALIVQSFCIASTASSLEIPKLKTASETRSRGLALKLDSTLARQKLPRAPAICHVGYTENWITFEFELDGPSSQRIPDEYDDPGIWDGPTAEVFIGSGTEAKTSYYHFAASPEGGRFDEWVAGGGWKRDPIWDGDFRVVKLEAPAGKWRVRMEIPLALLRRETPISPPRPRLPSSIWLQLGAVTMSTRPQPVTWAPSQAGFHNPDDFGRFAWQDEAPAFSTALKASVQLADEGVDLNVAFSGQPAHPASETSQRLLMQLRRAESGPARVDLYKRVVFPDDAGFEHRFDFRQVVSAKYGVLRLYARRNLVDQVVLAWPLAEDAPVRTVRERFKDSMELEIQSLPNRRVMWVGVRSAESPQAGWVWRQEPAAGITRQAIDTRGWRPGVYSLEWELAATDGSVDSTAEHSASSHLSLVRLPDQYQLPSKGFMFWAYHPEPELLNEYAAFATVLEAGMGLCGLIYGGAISVESGSMSRIDLGSLRAWKARLPDAQMHLMIDSAGNFDKISDDQVDRIADQIIEALGGEPDVDGVHFDLEPYTPGQVRLARALNRRGWSKSVSLAAGLASSLPPEQWSAIDFVVVMNYDLGSTPETFQSRASDNAWAFAEAAARMKTPYALGIPVIATHHEYGMAVEKSTGRVLEGGPSHGMEAYITAALEICASMQRDSESGDWFLGPALWGALGSGQGIGMHEYQYHPTIMDASTWTDLLDFQDILAGGN